MNNDELLNNNAWCIRVFSLYVSHRVACMYMYMYMYMSITTIRCVKKVKSPLNLILGSNLSTSIFIVLLYQ